MLLININLVLLSVLSVNYSWCIRNRNFLIMFFIITVLADGQSGQSGVNQKKWHQIIRKTSVAHQDVVNEEEVTTLKDFSLRDSRDDGMY